jgi:sterol O-acyltransferase
MSKTQSLAPTSKSADPVVTSPRSSKRNPSLDAITENDTYRYFILKCRPNKYPIPTKAGRVFKERNSRLDQETLHKEEGEPFRGFFTLFWTGMAYYAVTTLAEAYQTQGEVIKRSFFNWVMQDGWNLFLADIVLNLATFTCLVIQKAIVWKWIKRDTTGKTIQYLWECVYFTAAVAYNRYRDWPLVQSGFFTMHALAITLKMHSYLSHNGDLAILKESYDELKTRETQLETLKLSGEKYDADELEATATETKRLAVCLHLNSESRYPDNVSVRNFCDFLLVPCVVYQLEYPRRKE